MGSSPPIRARDGAQRTSVKLSGHTCVTAEPRCVQAAQKQKMPSGLCTQLAPAPSVRPRYDASLHVTAACEKGEAEDAQRPRALLAPAPNVEPRCGASLQIARASRERAPF